MNRSNVLPAHHNPEFVSSALGRTPLPPDLDELFERLSGARVLITGAAGSIGEEVSRLLRGASIEVLETDRDDLDVRRARAVSAAMAAFRPTHVYHLAGAKHAPDGEVNPLEVMEVNAIGTANVVAAAGMLGARVVTTSTCKACDPETAYGASKLLAERLTLAQGQSVARFYNVVETSGNVFELWSALPEDIPLPVANCRRFFISLAEAAGLTLWTAIAPPGRYTIDPGLPRSMGDVARALFPGRELEWVPARRGDRIEEPRHARSEQLQPVGQKLERVWSPHDDAATQYVAFQKLAA
jgi:FlaA1/EpsC-like NDP-sugar epimerase